MPDAIADLSRAFRKVQQKGFKVHYINLVDKNFAFGTKPNKKDIDSAKSEFTDRLLNLNPRFIVPMGAAVLKLLTGKNKIKDWAGRRIDINGFSVIPSYHPDFARKSKRMEREYEAHLKNAVSQICGDGSDKMETDYRLHTSEDDIVETLRRYANSERIVAFDWETTALEPHLGIPVCLNLSDRVGHADVVYWYDRFGGPGLTPRIKKAVAGFLTSKAKKVAHNAKFEIKWSIQHFEVEPVNLVGDTQQMHHLLDAGTSAGLKDLAYQHTDMGGYDTPMLDFLSKGNHHHDAPPQFMLPYAGGDADCTLRVHDVLEPKISSDRGLLWLWRNVVLPSIFTLARLELRGMHIDYAKVSEVEDILNDRVDKIKKKISGMQEVKKTVEYFRMQGGTYKKLTEINLGSPPQVRYLLYKVCRLPIPKSKKKGQKEPSTDKEAMIDLAGMHPIIDCITELRSAEYELGVISVLREKRRSDDTVYSELVQDYVLTGRLASRNPNLQNIPTGSLVKTCFDSRFKNGVIQQADWDQLEIKLIGGEAKDAFFMDAYEHDRDIHMETAVGLFKKSADKVSKEERTDAKRTNFGVIYGITEYGLSKKLRKTEETCAGILEAWWDLHPDIRRWARRNVEDARQKGYVVNRLGRKRLIEGIDSDKWWIAEAAKRLATNSKIQSLGADITMWFMAQIDQILIDGVLESVLVGQVHDSILVDCHPDEAGVVRELIQETVEYANELFSFLNIPLTMSCETGSNWGELKEVEVYDAD